jgi:hypothetical protein
MTLEAWLLTWKWNWMYDNKGGGVTLLASIDISTLAPWIMQNEQHFVASEIPHELDAQMEGH